MKERLLSRLWSGPGLRILFSEQAGWEPMIRRGFAHTRHELEFGDLSGHDLARYDLIVPLTVADTLWLGTQRHAITHSPLPIPDAHCVHLCNDKLLLGRELCTRGFAEFVPTAANPPVPPFVLKKRIAENSEHCYLVEDAEAQARYAPLIASDEFMCQRLVGGASEFASHILVAGGRVVTETTIEYVADREAFIKAGTTFVAKKIGHSAFTPLFERILAAIGFEGLCCVNYKVADKRPLLLEINPRFGGSLSPLFFAFIRHLPAARQFAATRIPADRRAA